MDSFTIKGDDNFITITIEEVYEFPDKTCSWGGYDTRAIIEINSSNFRVKSHLYTSTGEMFVFFQQLKECNSKLTGTAIYQSYEGNLKFTASYDNLGHVSISGEFSKQDILDNRLRFTFNTDQSFIKYTIDELDLIASKYGDMEGVKNKLG